MDAAAQWPEGMEEKKQQQQQQQQRPQKPPVLNCPRCNSTHTKFCYYNNYSLTQPRYFCKTCRRYWTEGGSLRNVPVGGGSRKNKRPSSSSPSTLQPSSSSKITKLCSSIPDDHHHHNHIMGPPTSHFSLDQNPNKMINNIHEGQDLNLGYPQPNISEFTNLPFNQENKTYPSSSTTSTTTSPQFSAMEFLKSGVASRGFMSSFISMPMSMPIMPASDSHSNSINNIFSSAAGIPFQEFKSSLNFPLNGFESGYNNGGGSLQGVQESGNNNTSARLFFPFEELKPTTSTDVLDDQQNRGQEDSNGYWNGGGSW